MAARWDTEESCLLKQINKLLQNVQYLKTEDRSPILLSYLNVLHLHASSWCGLQSPVPACASCRNTVRVQPRRPGQLLLSHSYHWCQLILQKKIGYIFKNLLKLWLWQLVSFARALKALMIPDVPAQPHLSLPTGRTPFHPAQWSCRMPVPRHTSYPPRCEGPRSVTSRSHRGFCKDLFTSSFHLGKSSTTMPTCKFCSLCPATPICVSKRVRAGLSYTVTVFAATCTKTGRFTGGEWVLALGYATPACESTGESASCSSRSLF